MQEKGQRNFRKKTLQSSKPFWVIHTRSPGKNTRFLLHQENNGLFHTSKWPAIRNISTPNNTPTTTKSTRHAVPNTQQQKTTSQKAKAQLHSHPQQTSTTPSPPPPSLPPNKPHITSPTHIRLSLPTPSNTSIPRRTTIPRKFLARNSLRTHHGSRARSRFMGNGIFRQGDAKSQ